LRYDSKEGIWTNDAEQFIRTILRKQLMGDEQQKKNYIDEIISYLKDFNFDPEFEVNGDNTLIGFKNKVCDLLSGEQLEHSPGYNLTNKLNIELDEDIKDCPVIDKFFCECVGEEHKQILYDLAAYCLFRGYPYQKIFFIYGPAGTGKSVFMNLLESFIGEANRCSVEPKQLQKDKHSTSQMLHKLANIVSDINYDDLDNITQIKKLCGDDTVTIRQMYKDPYNAKLTTKQIYSTNKLPIVKEKTNAWYRRVYLIEFSKILKQEERDPFLLNKLTAKKELQGFAYKCLESLKKLYENKFVFTFDINEGAVAELYEELSNPLLMFIKENCILGRDDWVYKYEFDERLNNWLKNNHFPTQTKSQINQYMRENYSESNRPSFDNEKTYRVWVGLRWKTSQDTDNLNQFNHFNQKIKKVYIYRGIFQTPLNPLNPLKQEDSNE